MSATCALAETPPPPVRSGGPEEPGPHLIRLLERRTGLPFAVVDSASGAIVSAGERPLVPFFPPAVLRALGEIDEAGVIECVPDLVHYAVRVPSACPEASFALGYALRSAGVWPAALVDRAEGEGWDAARIDRWLEGLPIASGPVLERLLALAREREAVDAERELLEDEVETLETCIQQTYEEISLLHTVTRHLHIQRSPAEVAEMCLGRVHLLAGATGTAIWLQEAGGRNRRLVMGHVPFDTAGLARIVARFDDHDWQRPLVRNHLSRTPLAATEPDLESLVVVPIAEGPHRYGWIVACNMPDGGEFGTPQASLLGSVATILGTHVRNIELYNEHEQLLLSLVQSFVSTLDAKDPYTRGHSERVALIARRIAEEMGLSREEVEDVHLSGVLHDVGKIGVDDSVLRKPGRLTEDEFEQIKQHPAIGYNILVGVKNLRKILPGVRNHHENWDGTGYPDRLAGTDIPLMARIIAVADAYDAMGSDRPYRAGMPLEKLEAIFREGADRQWDGRILEAYFRARDDVRAICERYSAGGSVRV